MNQRIARIAIGLTGLLVFALPVRADDATVKKELQAIYDKILVALKNKDHSVGNEYIAKDFQEKTVFGQTFTRDQVAKRIEFGLRHTQSVQNVKITVLHVAAKGNHAAAMVKTVVAATIKGPKGKVHKFTSDSHSVDLWTKTGDIWKLRQSDGVSVKQTIDGKPIRPQFARQPGAAGAPKN